MKQRKTINKLCIIVLALLFASTTNAVAFVDYSDQIQNGTDYLSSQQNADGSIAGFGGTTAWATMAFVSTGSDPTTISKDEVSLIDYLKNNQPDEAASPTVWSREILAIVAVGENPYDFGGLNYVQSLLAHYENNQIGDTAYLNDDVFGLLALLAVGETVDEAIIQNILSEIISNQETDHGFGWSNSSGSDVDTTAATLQALIAAREEEFNHTDLDSTISSTLNYLQGTQNSDGGFPYAPGDASNVSSTAWTVMALRAAGITGDAYDTAQAYIIANQHSDGSFCWMGCDFGGDTFTSSYAIMALGNTVWPMGRYGGPAPDTAITPSPTPTQPQAPTPTVSANSEPATVATPSAEGDVLAEVEQLPETGTGIGAIAFFSLVIIMGILTKELLKN